MSVMFVFSLWKLSIIKILWEINLKLNDKRVYEKLVKNDILNVINLSNLSIFKSNSSSNSISLIQFFSNFLLEILEIVALLLVYELWTSILRHWYCLVYLPSRLFWDIIECKCLLLSSSTLPIKIIVAFQLVLNFKDILLARRYLIRSSACWEWNIFWKFMLQEAFRKNVFNITLTTLFGINIEILMLLKFMFSCLICIRKV